MSSSLSGVEITVVKDALLVTLFLAIGAIINLPFEIYSKFIMDKKFGFFNSTTGNNQGRALK